MRAAALLVLVTVLGIARPAGALVADFVGTLAVRPARGSFDVVTGTLALAVRRWRWVPGVGSDGIDPAHEPITVLLGSDEVALPTGSVRASADARRYEFRDDRVTRGVTRLRLKRRGDGAWLLSVRLAGMAAPQLLTQYPRCEPLALLVGNDAGVSGVDLDRPRGVDSPRLKLRGFCRIEGCPGVLRIRPLHVICPF